MSKILVAGGAGYIGSHFVKRALEKGHEIVVVDNLSTGHRKAIPTAVTFYELDVRDREKLYKVFADEKPDAVVHFAANSLVEESMSEPLKYFDNNTYGMICLLDVMKDTGVKKLIFSSTAATYGVPETIPIKETDPQVPINPYGESKLQMEHIMAWADKAYGIKGVALRYFNVAGAAEDGTIGEDHNPETHLVPNILYAAVGKADKITMFGDDYDTPDGFNVRDYVHPVDLADAHLLAIEYLQREQKSNAFNLGSSTGFSVKQMVDAAEKVVGQPIPQKIGPRRPGDPDTLVADSAKAREVLNWQPQYDDVEKIIATAWNWTKNHPDGFDD
jgi:UDP-glucose 4-epimerase